MNRKSRKNDYKKHPGKNKNNKKDNSFKIVIIVALIAAACTIGTFVIAPPMTTLQAENDDINTQVAVSDQEPEKEKNVTRIEIKDEGAYTGELPRVLDDPKLQKKLENQARTDEDVRNIMFNAGDYTKRLLSLLAEHPKMKDFVMDYPSLKGKVTGGFTKEELEADYPLILQFDKRWGYYEYGNDIMAFTGCAPTVISMVSLYLTHNPDVTPDAVAKYATDMNLYINEVGTDWSLMNKHCEHFGIKGEILNISETNMKRELESGHPLIISLGPGEFTKNGHFVVISGVKDGKFVLRDCSSVERSEKLWSFDELVGQIKGIWKYEG